MLKKSKCLKNENSNILEKRYMCIANTNMDIIFEEKRHNNFSAKFYSFCQHDYTKIMKFYI